MLLCSVSWVEVVDYLSFKERVKEAICSIRLKLKFGSVLKGFTKVNQREDR